jgi:hypothetical protein
VLSITAGLVGAVQIGALRRPGALRTQSLTVNRNRRRCPTSLGTRKEISLEWSLPSRSEQAMPWSVARGAGHAMVRRALVPQRNEGMRGGEGMRGWMGMKGQGMKERGRDQGPPPPGITRGHPCANLSARLFLGEYLGKDSRAMSLREKVLLGHRGTPLSLIFPPGFPWPGGDSSVGRCPCGERGY